MLRRQRVDDDLQTDRLAHVRVDDASDPRPQVLWRHRGEHHGLDEQALAIAVAVESNGNHPGNTSQLELEAVEVGGHERAVVPALCLEPFEACFASYRR